MCCVYATQPGTGGAGSSWERRTGRGVCDASLPWGLAARATHEATCPHGAEARAQAAADRTRRLEEAQRLTSVTEQQFRLSLHFHGPTTPLENLLRRKRDLMASIVRCDSIFSSFLFLFSGSDNNTRLKDMAACTSICTAAIGRFLRLKATMLRRVPSRWLRAGSRPCRVTASRV